MGKIKTEELLTLLERNGRASFTELASALGVTEAAVRKRIRKLKEEGVIRGFKVDTDPKKLGYNAVTWLGVDTEPEELVKVLKWLKNRKEVKELYTASGDHMIMALVWARNYEELEKFIKDLERAGRVKKVCPAVLLEKVK